MDRGLLVPRGDAEREAWPQLEDALAPALFLEVPLAGQQEIAERDQALALGHADRGYVLETGRIVLADSAALLIENPLVRRVYLGLTAVS